MLSLTPIKVWLYYKICFLFLIEEKPRRTPEVRPNPLVLAWVTNMLTSPNLHIEFSRVLVQTPWLVESFLYKAINYEQSD